MIHSVAVVGIALVITGSVNVYSAETVKKRDNDNHLRDAGVALLLVLWLILALYAARMVYWSRHSKVLGGGTQSLAAWTFGGALLIGVKIVYAAVYTFDSGDKDISPVTGMFVFKVVLVVGVQILAVVALMVRGWVSLGGRKEGGLREHFEDSCRKEYVAVKQGGQGRASGL